MAGHGYHVLTPPPPVKLTWQKIQLGVNHHFQSATSKCERDAFLYKPNGALTQPQGLSCCRRRKPGNITTALISYLGESLSHGGPSSSKPPLHPQLPAGTGNTATMKIPFHILDKRIENENQEITSLTWAEHVHGLLFTAINSEGLVLKWSFAIPGYSGYLFTTKLQNE